MTETIDSVATDEDQNVKVTNLSVVLTGVVVGYIVGHVAIKINQKLSDRKFEKTHKND